MQDWIRTMIKVDYYNLKIRESVDSVVYRNNNIINWMCK